jgi:two-component system chemotaxis response regulator CheB
VIKVVIADDSPFLRQVLTDVLETSGKVKVVAAAKNGKEAIEYVKSLSPDVLILDCEMPVMNGLEALRRIMGECPLPVFMFSSLTAEGAAVTIKALEYGAVDFLQKPTKGAHALNEVVDELIHKIEAVARRWKFRGSKKDAFSEGREDKVVCETPRRQPISMESLVKRRVDIVAIGSSTGGVQAAVEVVNRLPERTKPIVWVQHMPPTFTGSFAARLNSCGKIRVHEAKNGQVLEDNTCYIAPGGFQMRVRKVGAQTTLNIHGTEKVNGFCPSCDVLFESVHQCFGETALGVILTGMGDDGARQLVEMRKKGAFVIGQNEESCVVYGMPKSAYQMGGVDVELDIVKISEGITKVGGAFS